MNILLNLLKSKAAGFSAAAVTCLALIFLFGPRLGFGLVEQLIAVIVILVIFGLIALVMNMRASKNASALEDSIKAQAQQQMMGARPDKRAEIEALKTDLERAIAQLKQSKLGRGRRGKNALYALPWYMFIGPPAAGKTTAIANSGLNFPLGSDRIQGVGGTRNCDWFFSDSAILLDTAGRYTTEYEDNDEWIAFLETLAKHRSKQPINGVLVGINVDELVGSDPNQVLWHADNIRRRIDELIKHLGVRFPVYLVFTKCDLLQGFAEFFGDLTRQERSQIWGATLEADVDDEAPVRDRFEQEFDRLHDRLVDVRLDRLSRPMKREVRSKVYTFPLQFASTKESISRFVHQLFLPNPYQETPIFRGFYFTSGTQEGVPIDQVIQALAQQFDLATDTSDDFAADVETKSYFINRLFTDVVIPDEFLAQKSSKATRRGHLVHAGISVAALLVLTLFVTGATLALRDGVAKADQAAEASALVENVSWDTRMAAAARDQGLDALDALRDKLNVLREGRFLGFGLQPGDEVVSATETLYQSNLRDMVHAFAIDDLERQLRQDIPDESGDRAAQDTLFKDLKAYLLLTRADPTLRDRRDSLTVENQEALASRVNYAMVRFIDPQTRTEQIELSTRLYPHAAAYVQALIDADEAVQDGDQETHLLRADGRPGLIDQARREVGDINAGVYYDQIINEVIADLRMPTSHVTLREIVRAGASYFEPGTDSVSRAYMRNAVDLVNEKIEERSANPYSDGWVLNKTERTGLGDLERELKSRYYQQYENSWSTFLRSARLRPFTSLDDAARTMQTLSEASRRSPVVQLLAVVTNETMLCEMPGLPGGTTADQQDQVSQALPCDGRSVMRAFNWLHGYEFNRAESGSPPVDQLLNNFGDVFLELDDLSAGGDVVVYAGEMMNARTFGLGANLLNINGALRNFDTRVGENLFEEPIANAGKTVIRAAAQEMNDRWRRNVYDAFQNRLDGRYPFSTDSGAADADLRDVQDFFGRDAGLSPLQQFREDLQPFLESGDLERPARWQREGFNLSVVGPILERAERIGRAVETGFSFRVSPDITRRRGDNPPPASLVTLDLHGTQVTYDQGQRQWTDVQWPGDERGASIRVATRLGGSNTSLNMVREGTWALFKLMGDAQENGARGAGRFMFSWDIPHRSGSFAFVQPVEVEVRGRREQEQMLVNPRQFFNVRPPESPRL